MKAGKRLATVVLSCAALALLAAPGSAVAKPGYFVTGPGRAAKLRLRGSGGYAIQVTAYQSGQVTLTARKGREMAWYSVKGKGADDGSIEARFPGLGEVAVAFKPRGRAEERAVPDNCKGRKTVIQRGAFIGRIRFRGERGFTEVGADHARGRVVHHFKQVCRNGAGGGGDKGGTEVHWTMLYSSRPQGRNALSFSAFQVTVGSAQTPTLTAFNAAIAGRRHGMTELRTISARGGAGSFRTDPGGGLESAAVSPPPPFAGSAEFSWTGGQSADWTGSLAVELPGADKVALAGPGFTSELCLDLHCTETAPGTPVAPGAPGTPVTISVGGESAALPGRPQLSGSHSQVLGDARLSWSR